MKATVSVTLRGDVLDPQGRAIQHACAALGHGSVRSVRQGKLFELELDESDPERARALLDELCRKLLANPVIEDYRIESITRAGSGDGAGARGGVRRVDPSDGSL